MLITKLYSILSSICEWLCRLLPSRELGRMLERLRLYAAGDDIRIGEYALNCNNPQALRFLIDCYPTMSRLFDTFPRMSEINFLDVGPAFGASAGLIADMHRSNFLGPKITVDVLDITQERKKYIELCYPLVNFIQGNIESIEDDKKWDIIYCSNVIEHIENPKIFIEKILSHARYFAIFVAPFCEECPMSPGHISRISKETFIDFSPSEFITFKTHAWPVTADGMCRKQVLVVMRPSNLA